MVAASADSTFPGEQPLSARIDAAARLLDSSAAWRDMVGPVAHRGSASWLSFLTPSAQARLLSLLAARPETATLTLESATGWRCFEVALSSDSGPGSWSTGWRTAGAVEAGVATGATPADSGRVFEQVFDGLPEPMMVARCDDLLVFAANRAAERLYAFPEGAMLGLPISLLLAATATLTVDRPGLAGSDRGKPGASQPPRLRARYVRCAGYDYVVLTVSEGGPAELGDPPEVARARELFERAPVAMLVVDSGLRVVQANGTAASLFRAYRDQLIGLPLADLVDSASAEISGLLEQRPARLTALQCRRRDFSEFGAEASLAYPEPGSGIAAILAIREPGQSIHRLRQLQEAEERWRFALEGTDEAVWDWNLPEGRVFRSPRWATMLGYPPAMRHRLGWAELIHPKDRSFAIDRLRMHVDGVVPVYEADFRMRCADGSFRWIAGRGRAIRRDAHGRALRILGTHRDVSENHRILDSLRESERRWQFALEGHGDALWDWNLATGEVMVSNGLRSMLGFEGGPVVRVDEFWPGRTHPEDVRLVRSALGRHLQGRTALAEASFRVGSAGGQYRWTTLRAKIMAYDSEGLPLRMIGTLRDCHAQRLQADRERRQQQELAHAGRLLLMGEMASALAHELNQPLAALSNFSGLCLRHLPELGERGESLRAPLEMIARQSLRAGEIVHRVRGFVRKSGSEMHPQDLRSVILEVLPLVEFESRQWSVRIRLEGAEGLPAVLCDRTQIEQVLLNLLRNGIEATRGIDVERQIVITCRVTGAGRVEVWVADNGGGMPEIILRQGISPFMTTKLDGLGLGLTICLSIIESHGGQLAFESRPEGGTVFKFDIPVASQ